MTAVSRNSDSTPGGTSCTLHLLGGFELFVDGRPLSIPDASQNVIAFLALQTAPVRRSFVAGSLWSGKDEARAAANLRSALWRLPPAAAKLVVGSGTSLRLDRSVSVDYCDVMKVAGGIVRGDPEIMALPGWAEFQILSAELLPGWYDDWIVTERERLAQTRLRAFEVLGRRALERGNVELAIGLAQSVVLAEPLRETGHLLLARAHLANGNRPDALRQIKRLDAILRTELGISASAEAWRLAEQAVLDPDREVVAARDHQAR